MFWGTTYFSDSKQIPEVKYSKDFTKSKQLCYNYNYGIAGVGINVQMCGNGKAGINVNKVNITAKTGAAGAPFDKSTKIGDVDALVTPNASLGLSATASLNVAVAKAGVTGTLTLVSVNVPATATMQWGLIAKNNKPALVVKNTTNVDVDVSLLSGKATVWVKVVKPKWCSCGSWCPGYPCTTWKSVVNKNLFSFSAYNLKKNLYKSSSQIELQ